MARYSGDTVLGGGGAVLGVLCISIPIAILVRKSKFACRIFNNLFSNYLNAHFSGAV